MLSCFLYGFIVFPQTIYNFGNIPIGYAKLYPLMLKLNKGFYWTITIYSSNIIFKFIGFQNYLPCSISCLSLFKVAQYLHNIHFPDVMEI